MSANKPLVSIVVPTYKRADRIRVALDSIAAQDYGAENIDLIVVSDNRPEWPESAETDAAVAPYAVSLPHFRLLHTAGQTGGGGRATTPAARRRASTSRSSTTTTSSCPTRCRPRSPSCRKTPST